MKVPTSSEVPRRVPSKEGFQAKVPAGSEVPNRGSSKGSGRL